MIFNLCGDLNSGDLWIIEVGVIECICFFDYGINSGLMNENNSDREIKIYIFYNY